LDGVLVVTKGVTSVANLTQAGGKQEFVLVTSTGSVTPFSSVDTSAISNDIDGSCQNLEATQENRGTTLVMILELKETDCVRYFASLIYPTYIR
jgi:hypothetical protein